MPETAPTAIVSVIQKIKVNILDILLNLIQIYESYIYLKEIKQTKKRPNFRFEDAPSNRYKNKVKIVVGVDSSGSVSERELEEFFGQIKHMWKAGVKVDVCIWDTNVHLEYEYKGENKFERVCQGGTYASSFIEYVNKHKRKKNWTCAINLTDGYIENEPSKCKLPMLWVITNEGSTSFKHKGKKIKMKS
jgi:predicted metal-dependent peptidase